MNASFKLPNKIPTWKVKHSRKALEAIATDVALFNRGYRMLAINPGDLMFPSWSKCRKSGLVLGELQRRKMPAYIGVDLSSPTRPGNAIAAVGLEPGTMRRYLLEIMYGKWTSPETAAALADVCSRHNVQWIQVENNAYQGALIDWVRKDKVDFPYWMKIEPYTTGEMSKIDREIGLPSLEVEFHNDAWLTPWSEWEAHSATCRCDWCRLDTEFKLYPKGATFDGIMAVFFARDALNKWAPRNAGPRKMGRLNQR